MRESPVIAHLKEASQIKDKFNIDVGAERGREVRREEDWEGKKGGGMKREN